MTPRHGSKNAGNLPDFSPNDILNFVALVDKGYFVLNDTVLDHEFDQKFTQAFIDVWLSDKSSFIKLQPQLLGKEKPAHDSKNFNINRLASLLMKKIRCRNYHQITILNKTQRINNKGEHNMVRPFLYCFTCCSKNKIICKAISMPLVFSIISNPGLAFTSSTNTLLLNESNQHRLPQALKL